MKKTLAMLLAAGMMTSMLASCSTSSDSETTGNSGNAGSSGNTGSTTGGSETPSGGNTESSGNSVDLMVVTSYGGEDANRKNYEEAYRAFETDSGHTVIDVSAESDETWKASVMTSFQTGSEPDVLFYFSGVDANSIVEESKVVSIEEIRQVYPDYAGNMQDERLPTSPYDSEAYAVPVNGYWEGMFVNKNVLEASGVEVPGADYTWEQFIADCQTIKDAGFTPIAASLMHVPHYWFEFTVLNNGTAENHASLPVDTSSDSAGLKWSAAMEDIKELYDLGFFPRNTLTAEDGETGQLMTDDQAAFMIDGSWKIAHFVDNADPADFTVTYVPGKGDRVATDAIGGFSMGYYITRQAWDDPDTRQAAVDFVTAMTTDEVVSKFAVTSTTALKGDAIPQEGLNSLQLDAIEMANGMTAVVDAAQDNLTAEARGALFAGVKEVMAGQVTSAELLQRTLGIS